MFKNIIILPINYKYCECSKKFPGGNFTSLPTSLVDVKFMAGLLLKVKFDHRNGPVVRQPSIGQQDNLVKFAEHAGGRLVDCAYHNLPHPGDGLQGVDDVRGRVAVQPRRNLVAK